MRNYFVQVLLSYMSFVGCVIPPNVLVNIIDQFEMADIVIQPECFTFKENAELLKIFSGRGDMIKLKIFSPYESFLTCADSPINFYLETQTRVPVVVITQIEKEMDLNKIDISIGDEVYFVDKSSLKTYEAYEINHMHVKRYLGQFHNTANNLNAAFVPAKTFIDSIVKRRGDFHGLQLNGMLESFPPHVYFPDNMVEMANYFPDNETYDLTNIARGTYVDVLNHLEEQFNFSTKLFKRKDGKWGVPKKMQNGSIQFEGMLQSVVEGPADLICMISMIPSRFEFLDFLSPISQLDGALFIADINTYEMTNWKLYFEPFSIYLWMIIFLSAFSFMIIMAIIERGYMIEKISLVNLKI